MKPPPFYQLRMIGVDDSLALVIQLKEGDEWRALSQEQALTIVRSMLRWLERA